MSTQRSSLCLAIAGPTASGKTAAALALAERWPIEIISVDSALVYRGMDIGTAKPSAAELAAAPHHLIDIIDPADTYSAARFVADAQSLIADIHARGRTPVLVGGTMLYLKALMEGLDEMPPADEAVRQRLEAEALALGWPAMHERLQAIDPLTAQRLAPLDAQRIQRALEVYEVSGRPLSAWHASPRAAHHNPLPPGALLSLEPTDRAWLHERIAQRFDHMMQNGLVDEVLRLRARGDLSADMPSMRCVGYRQVWEALDTHGNTLEGAALRECTNRGVFATRQLAKRQITWLRSMPQRTVVACDAPNALNQVLDWAAPWLQPKANA
jgi:tRNA dimethylallyltransferase